MRLTHEKLDELFPLHADVGDEMQLSSAWVILRKAEIEGGIALRDALYCAKGSIPEMSIFIDQVLQPSDLDDVVYVIDMLLSENTDGHIWAPECLPMLHAWRARVQMGFVLDKRNAISATVKLEVTR